MNKWNSTRILKASNAYEKRQTQFVNHIFSDIFTANSSTSSFHQFNSSWGWKQSNKHYHVKITITAWNFLWNFQHSKFISTIFPRCGIIFLWSQWHGCTENVYGAFDLRSVISGSRQFKHSRIHWPVTAGNIVWNWQSSQKQFWGRRRGTEKGEYFFAERKLYGNWLFKSSSNSHLMPDNDLTSSWRIFELKLRSRIFQRFCKTEPKNVPGMTSA